MSTRKIIDLHIHSSLKPFGRSFENNAQPNTITDPSCLWFEDNHLSYPKGEETYLGLSRYRQSDFTNLTDGQCRIACISLYPLEKEFTQVKGPLLQLRKNDILNSVTGLGKKRIKQIASKDYNYFEAYKEEYLFLEQLSNTKPMGGNRTYQFLTQSDDLDTAADLLIIPTVEGCHFLCEGNDTSNPHLWMNIEKNILFIKQQKHPLFFVSLAHHFYNHLCTHAKSLYGFVGTALNQKDGMDDVGHASSYSPISPFGEGLIDMLLSPEVGGRRIFIDVKHMSRRARERYYEILESDKYKDKNIPIISSHCAFDFTGTTEVNINFNDIYQIYKSRGIIGIEMDQRILGVDNNSAYKKMNAYEHAFYFWQQIKTFAEHAYVRFFDQPDYLDLFHNPWQCIALGSDYDGIINPLDSYRDASYMTLLYDNLILQLENYWNHSPLIPKNHNGMNAEQVIHAIMYQNAYDFIMKHYVSQNEAPIV